MRIRWYHKPEPNGVAASLRHYNHQLATVRGSEASGWWWAAGCPALRVPLAVSRTMLVASLADAKRDAETYVRACLDQSE